MDKLPIPRVQVRRFRGKNGGFDPGEQTMYICELVGVTGEVKNPNWNEPWGHTQKAYAVRDAEDWAVFTGWPLVQVSTKRKYTETLELDKD